MSNAQDTSRDGFQEVFRQTMAIRWGDMDAFGHVNNTIYFRYVEQLRIEWMESTGLPLPEGQGPVIVSTFMNFRKQLVYPGNIVGTMLAKAPGRSSVDTRFELRREDDPEGVVYADGGAVIVWVNFAAEKSVNLPDALRALLPTA
jgi:acyl-CoA thioester hydrolase